MSSCNKGMPPHTHRPLLQFLVSKKSRMALSHCTQQLKKGLSRPFTTFCRNAHLSKCGEVAVIETPTRNLYSAHMMHFQQGWWELFVFLSQIITLLQRLPSSSILKPGSGNLKREVLDLFILSVRSSSTRPGKKYFEPYRSLISHTRVSPTKLCWSTCRKAKVSHLLSYTLSKEGKE